MARAGCSISLERTLSMDLSIVSILMLDGITKTTTMPVVNL